GEAQVDVVHADRTAVVLIRELRKRSEMWRDLADVKETQLPRESGGAVVCDDRGAGRQIGYRGAQLGVRRLNHARQRRRLRELEELRLLGRHVPHLLEVGEHVAVRLEDAPEVR